MRGLLAGKEALKAFYARYSAFVNAFLRFITAFAAVFLINQNIGLMPKLSGGLVPLFAGIICAFLPFGAIAFLIGIFCWHSSLQHRWKWRSSPWCSF
ncbi:MAG: hypothetical protein ACLT76_10445 [Clostridium fessum]